VDFRALFLDFKALLWISGLFCGFEGSFVDFSGFQGSFVEFSGFQCSFAEIQGQKQIVASDLRS